jgi:hypothetical protein
MSEGYHKVINFLYAFKEILSPSKKVIMSRPSVRWLFKQVLDLSSVECMLHFHIYHFFLHAILLHVNVHHLIVRFTSLLG